MKEGSFLAFGIPQATGEWLKGLVPSSWPDPPSFSSSSSREKFQKIKSICLSALAATASDSDSHMDRVEEEEKESLPAELCPISIDERKESPLITIDSAGFDEITISYCFDVDIQYFGIRSTYCIVDVCFQNKLYWNGFLLTVLTMGEGPRDQLGKRRKCSQPPLFLDQTFLFCYFGYCKDQLGSFFKWN